MEKTFSDRLRSLRNEKNLRQEDLGKELGMSKSVIALYETGQRAPKMSSLKEIAKYFNVSVDYLLGNSNERETKLLNTNLATLLKERDFHFNGQPLNDKDLEFIIMYLENIANKKDIEINTNINKDFNSNGNSNTNRNDKINSYND